MAMGESIVETRIIGGMDVQPNAYPWLARAITINGKWADCSGTLIAPKYILTAAHCITDEFRNHGQYQIGALCSPFESRGTNCGQEVTKRHVLDVFVHDKFKYGDKENNVGSGNYKNEDMNISITKLHHSNDYDFALVQLDEDVTTIEPVALDISTLSDSYKEGTGNLWAVGFGNTNVYDTFSNMFQNPNYPERAQHVELKYVSNKDCYEKYSFLQGGITGNMMCAIDVNQDACIGDSGGPLYDRENNILVGIISWGSSSCGDEDFPGVYSRVGSQFQW
eukprot:CAMPEP_0194119324 /NCGR_PEP_ID=MMETSP0150-20130528/38895_1 /TAXON_ID=122233 /ORGANISM="Chaetoceros debilis, Strain MM31A-1" /LENGTH=278 /DNA_ID=CAMNT_0038810989 /DNA_START=109 /DNA_END=942 /DNA_ORIENTATION=+